MQHARRIRPSSGPTDRRRLAAAALSAILPGAGQLANGRQLLGKRLLIPSVAAIAIVWLILQVVSLPRLAATLIAPPLLSIVLVLNGLILVWRSIAVLHAFFDQRYPGRSGRLGAAGLAVIMVFVTWPHLIGLQVGLSAQSAFGRIFEPGPAAPGASGPVSTPEPFNGGERVNVLLIAIDKTPNRTATLTDTMMVASLDPIGKTVSLVSIPRDLVNTPLGDGNDFGPKLNSLMSYADRNPDEFPDGGVRALQKAVGALLEIDIHYYATIDFVGFVKMVDAVGGIDVVVPESFSDPTYDGYGFGKMGWSVEAGPHHFDGLNALAFARSRKASGESDFSRQDRQQLMLLALRHKATESGSLLFSLPGLIDAVGDTFRTDLPMGALPDIAAIVDEIEDDAITRVVIRFPLVRGASNRYGSVQVPDLVAIRAMAEHVFSEPGVDPIPWPTPKPTAPPSVAPSP